MNTLILTIAPLSVVKDKNSAKGVTAIDTSMMTIQSGFLQLSSLLKTGRNKLLFMHLCLEASALELTSRLVVTKINPFLHGSYTVVEQKDTDLISY